MPETLRGRGPLRTFAATLALAVAVVALLGMTASCGGRRGATPPPPTVIWADVTPAANGRTATPTVTATPGPSGYPGPAPDRPTTPPAYPSQEATPTPATAYPGR